MEHPTSPVGVLVLLALVGGLWGCGSRVPDETPDPEPGVSRALAEERARSVRDLRYHVVFDVPEAPSDPVAGRVTIRVSLDDAERPLVLDFASEGTALTSVTIGGRPSRARAVNGHIVLPAGELTAGENVVEVVFRAGDAALNRTPEFLYTLFVPARAHLTFPCFDQPDLKARFTLELTTPEGWQAVGNGAEVRREAGGGRVRIEYAETPPIPTYLFAFAAGRFEAVSAERAGRTYRMFHRETDAAKVARSRDAIFDLHASALAWLEDYTAIPYQFGKFDFVLIPSFQFSGMEHPGAVYYNAASLLLDESATEGQMLARASVIAHETAHMWFGDLVTMRWFDDVWMKEVFANFLAAKIVNPAFPGVNHALRFLVAHYPAAYSVDRTPGTHPIRQELANLSDAGSLYGPIIYQKAPIVMRQLEQSIGVEAMQAGLREYLRRFAFGNATWLDLVEVLDAAAPLDVAAWSRAWVEEAARPSIATELEVGADDRVRRLSFVQADPRPERGLRWPQRMEVLLGSAARTRTIAVDLAGDRADVAGEVSRPAPDFVLPAGGGFAYGGFTLDDRSRRYLLRHAAALADPVARGAAWVTLWDEMLDGRVAPPEFLNATLGALASEPIEQNVQLLTGYADEAFWRFLSPEARQALAPRLEATLRAGLARARSSSLKATYFAAFRSIVTTTGGVAFLERVWRRRESVPGLTLAEPDEAAMALDLVVRSVPSAAALLEEQRARFTNPDRRARFEFVMPALSSDPAVRGAFFRSLADPANRRREPWVVEGLRYLNHPLRAEASRIYLRPALDLLEEIHRTGDIFFPKNWMDALLSGHDTPEAAAIVRQFLAQHESYPPRLRLVILQTADDLFRAAAAAAR